MPFLVWLFTGPRTGTGLYAHGPLSSTGSASYSTVVFRVPHQNWTLCAWSHFWYRAMPFPFSNFRWSTQREGGSASLAIRLPRLFCEWTPAWARKQRKRTVNAVLEMGFLTSGNGTITGNEPPFSITGKFWVFLLTFTLFFILPICIHFQIIVVILHYLPFYLHLVEINCI